MDTIIGLLVGAVVTAVATLAVGHYYFRRTTRKSIGIYEILTSQIFAGIESDVREQLRFTYQDREVEDLLQLQFLVANDGERAISNVIEPLRLDLPQGVELLDASILHRHPKSLDASITTEDIERSTTSIHFHFPLLNKGDFFFVKLLLSGKLQGDDFTFKILADDLPRSLSSSWLPPNAFEERKFRFEWGLLLTGLIFAGIVAWFVWALSLLYAQRPELFPFPWTSYPFTFESIAFLVPAALLCTVFGIIAFVLIVMSVFEGFPPTGPRFPLPKELQHGGFRFPSPIFPGDFIPESPRGEAHEKKDGAA